PHRFFPSLPGRRRCQSNLSFCNFDFEVSHSSNLKFSLLRPKSRILIVCIISLLLTVPSVFAQQQPPPSQKPTEIPGVKIEVISTTPLPGLDLPLIEIAAPAQGGHAE